MLQRNILLTKTTEVPKTRIALDVYKASVRLFFFRKVVLEKSVSGAVSWCLDFGYPRIRKLAPVAACQLIRKGGLGGDHCHL